MCFSCYQNFRTKDSSCLAPSRPLVATVLERARHCLGPFQLVSRVLAKGGLQRKNGREGQRRRGACGSGKDPNLGRNAHSECSQLPQFTWSRDRWWAQHHVEPYLLTQTRGHWDSTRSIFHHTDVTPSLFLLLIFLSWRFYVEISLSSQRASSLQTVPCSHQQSNSNSLDSSGSVPYRMSPHSAAATRGVLRVGWMDALVLVRISSAPPQSSRWRCLSSPQHHKFLTHCMSCS